MALWNRPSGQKREIIISMCCCHSLSDSLFICTCWLFFFLNRIFPDYLFLHATRFCFLIFFFYILFIYLWLCWVFASVWGLSPVAASGGHSSSWCAGLSPSRPLLLRSTVSRRAGSVIVAHGPSRSAACGILPDQGANPCPLHWQADSQPLRHQGSPALVDFWALLGRNLN